MSTCVEKRGGGLIALNAERIRPSSRGHDQEERGCVYINDNKTCFKKKTKKKKLKISSERCLNTKYRTAEITSYAT